MATPPTATALFLESDCPCLRGDSEGTAKHCFHLHSTAFALPDCIAMAKDRLVE